MIPHLSEAYHSEISRVNAKDWPGFDLLNDGRLTRSCCEVAFFNESPSRQTGRSLVVGCAAYAFDVSNHNVIVREYVSFQLV